MAVKKGILLINLGTPDSPGVADVRKYLREFLMDGRVIDIPWINRFFLVNCVIAPFRAPSSAKAYAKLWGPNGSPLKYYGLEVEHRLQQALGSEYVVKLAMRYQSPGIRSVMRVLKAAQLDELTVIPLYPQYASASTGSSLECFISEIRSWELLPKLSVVTQFFDHPIFIDAFAQIGRQAMAQRAYDHFLFSYHGLPERQILKASRDHYCQVNEKCCRSYHQKNKYCYRAQCYETTRLLAKSLGIREDQYTVSFQSRLGKEPWIKPYTDEALGELIDKGYKSVLCFSPSFVADCLETTIEIGQEYRHLFLQKGGSRLDLVESLNVSGRWIECLRELALSPGENLAEHVIF